MLLQFGEYALDEYHRALFRGTEQIEIERHAYLLLVHLVRNRDRIVSKDELFEALWDGDRVSQSSLPRCMNALRRALGDRKRGAGGIIETVYGRGYRFTATVQAIEVPRGAESFEEIERLIEMARLELRRGSFEHTRAHLLRAAALSTKFANVARMGRDARVDSGS